MTPERREVLTKRLEEAEDAWHTLMLGQTPRVFVDQNGERVEFTMNSKDSLRGYILDLKTQLGIRGSMFGPMNIRVGR